jgi:hypothetical protein
MIAVAAMILGTTSVVLAIAPFENHQQVVVSTRSPFVDLYDYTAGTPYAWTTSPEFAAGTLTSVDTTTVPGSVVLAQGGPQSGWWNTQWDRRRCDTVDNTAGPALSEFVVEVTLDTASEIAAGSMDANGNSLRAIAADGETELPLWLKGPLNSPSTQIWIQVDAVAAGGTTSYCLYWTGSNKPSRSDEASVLTTSTPQPRFVLLGSAYAGGADVEITPILDTTDVTNGSTTLSGLRLGKTGTLPAAGNAQGTLISATVPIAARGTGMAPAPAPLSFAGTAFAVPTERGAQTFVAYAPGSTATMTITEGGTVIGGPVAVPAGGVTTVTADVTTTGAVVTSDAPIVLVHETTSGTDAYPVPPASAGPWVGVRSQSARIGLVSAGAGTIARSDGSSTPIAGGAGDVVVDAGGAPAGGNAADGVMVTADAGVAVVQQDDGSGSATTAFLPLDRLDVTHAIPTDASYVTIVCPTPGTTMTIDPPKGKSTSVGCSGAGPGFGKFASSTAAGTVVTTSAPAWLVYEDAATGIETNLYGTDVVRQGGTPVPGVSPGPPEGQGGGYAASGTWESETIDTTVDGVYGTLRWSGTTPIGTSITFQVATTANGNPNSFVGPDGTAATVFSSFEDALAFQHDGDRYFRIRATLSTTDTSVTPTLDAVTLTADLPPLDRVAETVDRVTVVGSTGTAERRFAVRVRSDVAGVEGSTATVTAGNVSNLALLQIGVVGTTPPDADAIVVAGGTLGQSSGPPVVFDAANPHSIVIDQLIDGTGTAEIEILWRLDVHAGGSVFIDRSFVLEVTS